MIFCFSGTGNSRTAARIVASVLEDEVCPIGRSTTIPQDIPDSDLLGIVCPVYAWGLPQIVVHFLENLTKPYLRRFAYTFFILTCGDDIGQTDCQIRHIWQHKGCLQPAIFSVQMRNTYICLPGFDTDSETVEKAKHLQAEERLLQIARRIKEHNPSVPSDVTPGAFPYFKSHILRPFFNRFLMSDTHFSVSAEACIHCGKCSRICPMENIIPDSQNLPQWQGHCTMCLACYHVCPQHAINYGKFTHSKGQVKINF